MRDRDMCTPALYRALSLVRSRWSRVINYASLFPDVVLGTGGSCVEDMAEEERMRRLTQVAHCWHSVFVLGARLCPGRGPVDPHP